MSGSRGRVEILRTRAKDRGHLARDGVLPLRLEAQLYAEHHSESGQWAMRTLRDHPLIGPRHHQYCCVPTWSRVLTFVKQWRTDGDGRKLTIETYPNERPPARSACHSFSYKQNARRELDRIELYQERGTSLPP